MECKNFKNVNIYDTTSRSFHHGALNICGDRISGFDEIPKATDLGGAFIIPGIIDQHSHGRAGFDFNNASVEEMKLMADSYLEAGTSTVIPTLASAPYEQLLISADRIKSSGFDGVHLEGRYLNPKKRGAHNIDLLAPLNISEIETFIDHSYPLKVHITAALEMDGGDSFIGAAIAKGATVGIGHSDATFEQAVHAISAGASSFTHLFNAMRPFTHRDPGTAGAGLLSDAYVELICDGFHLHPQTVRLVYKTKSISKIILISDSMSATGCDDGEYSIAGMPVHVKNGKALGDDGTISGSTLNLFDGLINFTDFCSVSLEEAVPCVTYNPACMLGLEKEIGSIEVGKRADICIIAPDKRTLLGASNKGIFKTHGILI